MLLNSNILVLILQLAIHQCRSLPISSSFFSTTVKPNVANDETENKLETTFKRRSPVTNSKDSPASSPEYSALQSPWFTPSPSPERSASTSARTNIKKIKNIKWADELPEAEAKPLKKELVPTLYLQTNWKYSDNGVLEPLPVLPSTITTKEKHATLARANAIRAEKELRKGISDSKKSVLLGAQQGQQHLHNSIYHWNQGCAGKSIKEAGKALVKPIAAIAFSPVPVLNGLTGSMRSRGKALRHNLIKIRAPVDQESRLAKSNIDDKAKMIENEINDNDLTDQFISKILRTETKTPYRRLSGPIQEVSTEEASTSKSPFDFKTLRVTIPKNEMDDWTINSPHQFTRTHRGPRLIRSPRFSPSSRFGIDSPYAAAATVSPISPVLSSSPESPTPPSSPESDDIDEIGPTNISNETEDCQAKHERRLSSILEGIEDLSEEEEDLYPIF